jgi:seryl-tRNA synthetase
VSSRATRTFDLSRGSEGGVRAILEGLQIDRDNVLSVMFDEATKALTVETNGVDTAEKVEAFVAGMTRTHKLLPRKILMRNRAEFLTPDPIDEALTQSPDVQLLGAGLTGLRGELLALFRFFEREFARIADEFGAEDNHYPVMIPSEVLAEVGYFSHFPQHVTFCSHLPDSLPLLEAVAGDAQANAGGRLADKFASRLANPAHVLIPGVCLPCYRQQGGRTLESGRVRTLTMQNHVFRYEADNFRPLARAWDYSVRDIVFFGGSAELVRLRGEAMERTMQLCRELDLEVTIELANDPFFLDASRDKAVYQRMGEVKYELLFHLPHRKEPLAVSSFNLHRDFYTAIYDTRHADGALAESACMGFGLERWLYGFLCQKGLESASWPGRVTARQA